MVACAASSIVPATAQSAQEQQEQQIGAQVYQHLERQGKIIRESPHYDVLNPLAHRIASVADRRYFAPFHFILIRGNDPNAFAVPGGNVYVTETMMTFVQNKEELAGVLCHEVAHDIHHDVYDLYVKSQRISLWATLAQVLLGQRSRITSFAIDLLANVQVLRFSRDVETNADATGAELCAQAGITPWGMVWLMQRFLDRPAAKPPEFLSDHPTDSHRISDLERLFATNPQRYARFNASLRNATPLSAAGLRDQYAGNGPNEAAPAAPPPTPKRATPHPRATPTCPPGWKFCPPGTRLPAS